VHTSGCDLSNGKDQETYDELQSAVDEVGVAPAQAFDDPTADDRVDPVEELTSARNLLKRLLLPAGGSAWLGFVKRDIWTKRLEGRREGLSALEALDDRPDGRMVLG